MTSPKGDEKISLNLSLNHKAIMFIMALVGSIAGGAGIKLTDGGSGGVADSLAHLPAEVRNLQTNISNASTEMVKQKAAIDSTRREVSDIKGMVEELFCDKYPKNYRCRDFR